jgi:hypothetical protein
MHLPSKNSAWWASALGAMMSIGYSSIAVGLGASQAGNKLGSLAGRPAAPVDKVFGIFNSLGNIGFAYSSAIVLMEVENTLREPPKAEVSMKKTVQLGCVRGLTCCWLVFLALSFAGWLACLAVCLLLRTGLPPTLYPPTPRLGTTFFFYLLVSVLGYMALGNGVPDNVLLVRFDGWLWVGRGG